MPVQTNSHRPAGSTHIAQSGQMTVEARAALSFLSEVNFDPITETLYSQIGESAPVWESRPFDIVEVGKDTAKTLGTAGYGGPHDKALEKKIKEMRGMTYEQACSYMESEFGMSPDEAKKCVNAATKRLVASKAIAREGEKGKYVDASKSNAAAEESRRMLSQVVEGTRPRTQSEGEGEEGKKKKIYAGEARGHALNIFQGADIAEVTDVRDLRDMFLWHTANELLPEAANGGILERAVFQGVAATAGIDNVLPFLEAEARTAAESTWAKTAIGRLREAHETGKQDIESVLSAVLAKGNVAQVVRPDESTGPSMFVPGPDLKSAGVDSVLEASEIGTLLKALSEYRKAVAEKAKGKYEKKAAPKAGAAYPEKTTESSSSSPAAKPLTEDTQIGLACGAADLARRRNPHPLSR